MIELVLVIGFFSMIIGLMIVGGRQAGKQRAAAQARIEGVRRQIDGLRMQMQTCRDQSLLLDPKTIERVGLAQASVEEKLHQASTLLTSATKERHYDRIQRILTLVQAKIGNVQASLGRAQTRVDERAQRQAEAQERRAGSFGQKAAQHTPRTGSFAPPTQTTGAATDWNTISPAERGVCFFCSRPCLLRELTPVTVPIAGATRRVLACPQDFAVIRSGNLPPIRAFSMNGQQVPWFAYSRYNPYDRFYEAGYGVEIYVDTFPFTIFDPGYWNFDGPYAYNGGLPYVFTPDAEPYRDYYSASAAGAAAGAYDPNMAVPAFDPNNPNNPNFSPNYGPNDPNNNPNYAPGSGQNPGDYGPDGRPIGPDLS